MNKQEVINTESKTTDFLVTGEVMSEEMKQDLNRFIRNLPKVEYTFPEVKLEEPEAARQDFNRFLQRMNIARR